MNVGTSNVSEEFARGPIRRLTQILRLPFLKSIFLFRIEPRPAFGFAMDTATPRLGSQPRAKTVLSLAELPIKRISAQRLEDIFDCRRVRSEEHTSELPSPYVISS